MEIGLYTFAELYPDPQTGETISAEQRMRNLLEEVELADQVGLDVFGVGEHHRPDYLILSAPAVVLAAAAARTKNIRLTSAVTVLSSDDPVRVFQEFATVDLLSGGRVELMAGRGSVHRVVSPCSATISTGTTCSSRRSSSFSSSWGRQSASRGRGGTVRAPIHDRAGVYPRPIQSPFPVWIAVGGTPESTFERAGTLGLPLALAIIGGYPERFAPLVELYRESGARVRGPDPLTTLKVGINSHAFVADTSALPRADTFFPPRMQRS